MADPDGEYCILPLGHEEPHSAGPNTLRAWLEVTLDNSVIRNYAGTYAEHDFLREARIFEEFGFLPVSQSGTTIQVRPGVGSMLAWGLQARKSTSSSAVMFRRETAAAPAQTVAASIPDQIRALGELRESGLLTPAEFESKKAELLSRM